MDNPENNLANESGNQSLISSDSTNEFALEFLDCSPAIYQEAVVSKEKGKQPVEKPDDAAAAELKQSREFGDWLNGNFKNLDTDHDGFISKREVAQQIMDPKAGNSKDAANLATLYRDIEILATVFDNASQVRQAVPPNPRLSQKGIDAFRKIADDPKFLENNARKIAISHLEPASKYIDGDGNDKFDLKEITTALQNPKLTIEQRQALGDVQQYLQFHNKPGQPETTLTSEDLFRFLSPQALVVSTVGREAHENIQRLKDYESHKDIVSQQARNCFLLGGIISFQNLKPETLDKIETIKKDGKFLDRIMTRNDQDGSYTVTFPGDPKNPVTVSAPTRALEAGWGSGYDGKVTVLEQAVAKYQSEHLTKEIEEHVRAEGSDLNSPIFAERIHGGRADLMLELLSGEDHKTAPAAVNSAQKLQNFFKLATSKDVPLLATTAENTVNPQVFSRHVYSMNYDPNTNRVKLENPVKPISDTPRGALEGVEPHHIDGSAKDGELDGKFTMSIEEFKSTFEYIMWVEPGRKRAK